MMWCLLWFAPPAAATPAFDERAVFVSGQDGYHTFRIPALVRAADGSLLAFAEGRKNSSSDTGNIDLVLRRSTDQGATWGPLQVVWDNGNNTCGNPSPVLDATTGTLWLLSTWNLGSDSESMIVNGTSTDTRRVFRLFSTDHGATWSAAAEITSTTKQAGWTWYATGPGAGIQLKRGNQAGRLLVACDHIRADTKAFGSHVIYSDDHGANWQIGAIAPTTATVRPNENLAVELVAPGGDGGSRVFFNARDHQGPHTRATAMSPDGGLTYDGGVFTDAPQFVTPTVQGGLARMRATDDGDPGNRILFSCPNAGSRTRMSIWSSTDETLTWSAPKLVHEGPSAYSDMARLADGRIGLLYEKGAASPYETITFARFNEAWLDEPPPPAENPGAAFWNFEETPAGANVSTAAGAIKDGHPDGHGSHLTSLTAFPSIAGPASFGNGRAVSINAAGGLRILDSESGNRFDYGPAHSFTIEVVCRIPSGSTQIGALVAKDVGPVSPSWWLRVENGKARFLVSDSSAERVFLSTANINTGNWHHIAAVRDATNPANKQLRLFIDGQPSGSLADTTTGSFANGNALWIGRYNNNTRQLTGDIDFVRITPAALAPAAFATRTTQFDADADGIPDAFEWEQSAGLAAWTASDLAAYAFAASGPGRTPPATQVRLENGELVLTRDTRSSPFWLNTTLKTSENLVDWTPVAAVTQSLPMENGLIRRTDRLPLSSGRFFRYEAGFD